jgi:hypothetical protein
MSDAAKQKRGGMTHLRDGEMRKLVGQKNLGKTRSLETRQRIRQRAIERFQKERDNGGIVRQPHSAESRQRISQARKNMPRNRLVVCKCCNQEFMAQTARAQYCSGKCIMRAWRRRNDDS